MTPEEKELTEEAMELERRFRWRIRHRTRREQRMRVEEMNAIRDAWIAVAKERWGDG